ncbi:MAG: type III restriction endonuclease subunit R, partial [Spirochaetota bacterium]
KDLQKEIEEEEGIKFGIVEKHSFASLIIEKEDGQKEYFGQQNSEKLWKELFEKEYIDNKGKIQDKLKIDLKNNQVEIPAEFEKEKKKINETLKKLAGDKLNIKNADDKKEIKIKKEVLLSPEFKELWNKIKYKTVYKVEFDSEGLKKAIIEEIKNKLIVPKPKFKIIDAQIDINKGGVQGLEVKDGIGKEYITDSVNYIPDVITYIQNETNLTRQTIAEIIVESQKIDQLKRNPQKYLDEVIRLIKAKMKHFIVDGIKYEKIGDDTYYAQELFEEQELFAYIKKDMVESLKSPYTYIVSDSNIENEFAKQLELNKSVKVYTKLPDWFKIDTPLGKYNPDWAILVDKNGEDKLYFVVETKGTDLYEGISEIEGSKIKCAQKHFEAINADVKMAGPIDTFQKFEGYID